ncbi:unnamed protein product [Cylicocyclus nassatus]|uniref:Uncharacterized protein n=1 Tax=Cylicocyclus nassatus TaxID=53992 RepID=A0AA36GI50_CYLNA|nr:unnamed protein product [Cylicocyclus nassatus]
MSKGADFLAAAASGRVASPRPFEFRPVYSSHSPAHGASALLDDAQCKSLRHDASTFISSYKRSARLFMAVCVVPVTVSTLNYQTVVHISDRIVVNVTSSIDEMLSEYSSNRGMNVFPKNPPTKIEQMLAGGPFDDESTATQWSYLIHPAAKCIHSMGILSGQRVCL